MFATLLSVPVLIALLHPVLAQSGLWINTPAFVQCQPAEITWADTGYSPYDLLVASAQDMCGEALEDLGNQTCTAVTWTVNLAAGTQVALFIDDAVGNYAWSGNITVGDSNDTSCLSSTSTPTPTTLPASTQSVSRTALTVTPSESTKTTSSPTSSASGAVNAGSTPPSGALSTRPLGTVTLFSCAVLAAVAFTL